MTQHFIFKAKDGVYADETKKSSRIHGGRDGAVVGSLAARGVASVVSFWAFVGSFWLGRLF